MENNKPNAWRMCLYEIVHGLKVGVDVSIYAKPEFDSDQMSALRMALQCGLDVSKIAKPEYDSYTMHILTHCIELGIDISDFDNTDKMLQEYIEKCKNFSNDIVDSKIFGNILKGLKNIEKYSSAQLHNIATAIILFRATIDIINDYINPDMDPEYIYNLLFELFLTPDVIKYTSPDMDYEHISMIAHSLNNRVKFEDFKPYLDMYDEYEKQGVLKPYVDDEFDEEDCDGDCDNCLDPCEDFDENIENGENSVISEKDNKKSSYNKEDALRIAMNLLKGKK